MAKKNKSDFAKTSDKDLLKLLAEKREEVRRIRFDITGTKVKNVKEGHAARTEVARVMTELGARKRRSANAQQAASTK